MEIKQLRQFLAAAQSGSFTRGAALAHISQPALSASIAKLEDELGCQLFIRNKRNVVLTAEGHRLKRAAERICDEAEQVRRSFRQRKSRKILRIYAAPNFPTRYLSELLKGFAITTPHIHFDVSDAVHMHHHGAAEDKSFDMRLDVVAGGQDADPALSQALPIFGSNGSGNGGAGGGQRMMALKDEHYGAAIPSDHAFASRNGIQLADLATEPFIARMQCELRPAMEVWMKQQGISLNVRYRTDQDARALSLVSAGLGVTIAPTTLPTEGVRFLALRDRPLVRTLTLSLPPVDREDIASEIQSLVASLKN